MLNQQTIDVAAYVWPAYTGREPRTLPFWPEGMGEWQTVRNAVRKNERQSVLRQPLWGYVDEADPCEMARQIDAAADHGVNVFIYDWYWYDRRPFLEQCLNEGFLQAANRERMRFYLMWANHSVNNQWDIRLSDDLRNIIWDGAVDRAEFERLTGRVIERYFTQLNYYRLASRPVFMIYDLGNLIRGLGGIEATAEALAWFRRATEAAGFPGLHLQLALWSESVLDLSGVDGSRISTGPELVRRLGFDSLTHYQFVHFTDVARSYPQIMADVVQEWTRIDRAYDIPYFPHLSVGWDNNLRFRSFQSQVMRDNTPQAIGQALRSVDAYLRGHPQRHPLLTVNSWNEWTETSYLQPDDLYGYGYLDEIRDWVKSRQSEAPMT